MPLKSQKKKVNNITDFFGGNNLVNNPEKAALLFNSKDLLYNKKLHQKCNQDVVLWKWTEITTKNHALPLTSFPNRYDIDLSYKVLWSFID